MGSHFSNLLAMVLVCIFFAPLCHAQSHRDKRRFSLVVSSHSYSDLKTTDSEAGANNADIESAIALEIGTRIHTVFQLILTGYQSPNGDSTGMGGGFRIDIPGFFWMGGPKQLGVRRRFYPVNSSLFGTFIQDTIKNESGTTDKAMGTNMGITIDVFLFNRYVFLKGEASIKSVLGNSYLATGGGLGVEF